MKTILIFTEAIEKRKVILKHKNDIKIYIEQREDHIEWLDSENNLIKDRKYIVIRFPKSLGVDYKNIKFNYLDKVTTGFKINELENEVEILFYNRVTFAWYAYRLEKIGLFKMLQQLLPEKEKGEFLPLYINPNFGQFIYNLFASFLHFIFKFYIKLYKMLVL